MKRLIGTVTVTIVVALFLCCKPAPVSNGPVTNVNKPDEAKMSIKITSTAFADGEMVPKQYTCDGANVSPPLSWSGVPVNAKTLALICDDPDAPAKIWVHWVAYDLSASQTSLTENIAKTTEFTAGGKQGANDSEQVGYDGPCPPSGTHRYYFKLYALDAETSLKPGATKDQLLKAMEGHIVARGQLMGRYKR